MFVYRMAQSVLDRKHWYCGEVIVGELYVAIKDCDQMFLIELLRLRIRSVALHAHCIGIGRSQQVQIVAAVRLVADEAALLEGRLMQMRFLHLIGLIAMAR